MARGIFLGRSRAPEAIEIISNPVMKYSDALPRTDLRDVESVANNSRPVNHAVAQWDFQRPRTADGRKPIKKGQGLNPGFDFQIAVPPAEAVPLPKSPDDDLNANMIGIALGSPRMAEPQSILSQVQEQPPVSTSASPEQASPQTKTPKRKPSKWRKIGGLFKAKNALPAPANQPFYQLRYTEEWPLQESSHSVDYEHQCEAEKSEPENMAPAPPNLPNLEIWPCPEGENEPKSYVQSSLKTAPQDSVKNNDLVPGAKPRAAGPFLQIDIPDIQLERYSVMFGGVLNQNEPSLLKRRSKTLEDVRIPRPDASIPPPDFQSPRRRATSPQPRLPSFNLFPTQAPVSKASKVLGSQNIPRGPSPLHRSQTSLSGLGRQTPTNDPNHVLLMVQSPSIKSPVSHQTKDSVSSTVSMDSTEEERLLQKLKQTKVYVDKEREPEWEIISKKPTSEASSPRPSPVQNPTPSPRQRTPPLALTINTQALPSTRSSISSAPSPHLSPINSAARDKTERIRSPMETLSALSPFSTTRMPLSDDNEDIDANEAMDPIPKVEVSIARSVSVSRGKKQVIVPIRPRAERLNPDERLVVRQAKTPQVRDAHHGHRHGNSQDARIETI
ncbi:uncharacterized protein P174DRAFT_461855 [Aspergillus novofumigatus IBT 16806]|uniref:Uncharacterized protein n=1 Tax=Aspergillus novofumigatus (strain IBT 16806) TaxID=1392255 RepID=A0A2I1C768_ASPN1|nr:uncharacterized protein P174DRAFT_461855 [Aspergillus novofumigatus IBT 16806]PKX93431.1 hypothetical protein P174DRAFT_461855 [Aspergillus novofumigatus IBT 16806]